MGHNHIGHDYIGRCVTGASTSVVKLSWSKGLTWASAMEKLEAAKGTVGDGDVAGIWVSFNDHMGAMKKKIVQLCLNKERRAGVEAMVTVFQPNRRQCDPVLKSKHQARKSE